MTLAGDTGMLLWPCRPWRRRKTRLGSGAGAVSGAHGPVGCVTKGYRDTDSGTVQHAAAEWVDAGKRVFAARAAADDSGFSWAAGGAAGEVLEGASGGFADFRDSAFQPGDCGELGEGLPGAAVCDDYYGPGGFSAAILD